MNARRAWTLSITQGLALFSVFSALGGCSSAKDADATPPTGDSAVGDTLRGDTGVDRADTGATSDAVDSTPIVTVEQEPNNGNPETAVNPFAIPGDATGAIDPADDLDVLSVTLEAGDVWSWGLLGTGSGMTPHLAISQRGNRVPTMVAIGTGSGPAEQEHFVLERETYFLIVRDARNVPAAMSQHVGGPALTWNLSGRRLDKTPTAITFPKTMSGSLSGPSTLALYSFSATKDFTMDIDLRAQRKVPPSTMDSRMSLYERTTKTWVLTNDDVSDTSTDSHIGGVLPITGEYVVVVENIASDATDLSYEIAFSER